MTSPDVPQDANVWLAWAAQPTWTASKPGAQAPSPAGASDGLRAVLQPLPHLPAQDCLPWDAESRMRLAVALDVVCSATRKIAPGPTVLVQATQAWLSLRGRTQSPMTLEELVALARSPAAAARARISRGLTRAASGVALAAKPEKKSPRPSPGPVDDAP